MKVLKVISATLLVGIFGLLILTRFSSATSRFECPGKFTKNGEESPATLFLKLEKYRPWVGLWSESEGAAWVELPNQTVGYYGHVTQAGDMLQLWEAPRDFKGNFSTLSHAIGVDLGAFGLFEGMCRVAASDA